MCSSYGPPWGIPITEDVHEKYADEVKQAWLTFHSWWMAAKENGAPRRSDMPDEVRQAMALICETPIPDTDGAKGDESRYMIGVNSMLLD